MSTRKKSNARKKSAPSKRTSVPQRKTLRTTARKTSRKSAGKPVVRSRPAVSKGPVTARTGPARGGAPTFGAGAPKAQTPPAGVAVTSGIDVSHHNGAIAWARVRDAGHRYVFVKATEGVTGTDTRFAPNWMDARTAGLLRGAYHYYRPAKSPTDQADHFFEVVGPLDASDLPPVLDLEERTGWTGTPLSRVQAVQQFIQRVSDRFHRRPIVYTSRSFMTEMLNGSAALAGHALWVVDYNQSPPRLPAGWTAWTLWQHSETGSVAGIEGHVDLDWFRGDLLELELFISRSII